MLSERLSFADDACVGLQTRFRVILTTPKFSKVITPPGDYKIQTFISFFSQKQDAEKEKR